MQNLLDDLTKLLQKDDRFHSEGKLLKNKVVEAGLQLDPILLILLLSNDKIKKHFFVDVSGTLVFDKIKFMKFVSNKEFLPDSYTSFKNKIGLTVEDEFISEGKVVSLVWPYKDCYLEGGQINEDDKHNEIFWNEILAPDEIDRLLTPKALTNFKRFSSNKSQRAKEISKKDNLLIKGNNLLTLCSLRKTFLGQVKLIYIDPPYNTGKDSFSYNDSFNHSAWLTFIKNRIEIAKDLLKNEGVIFVSIDDGEHAYLKVLCDEIFGRANYLGVIIWETATDNNATQISVEHEYVIAYAKNKDLQDIWQLKSEKAKYIQVQYEKLKQQYKKDTDTIEKELRKWINGVKKSNEIDLSGVSHYSYVDDKGVFYPGNSANTRPGGYTYDIKHPKTNKVCKKPENGYRWPADTFWAADKKGDVLWPADEKGIPKIKKRLDTATELLKGYFYEDNRKSTKELTKLMGEKVFDNPKSINLLKKIIGFTTDNGDIVLDFFAGSGSTAQALMELNNEDKKNRQFILCEQLDYIDDVTAKRIQKVLDDKSTFVFAELAMLNETFIKQIKGANTTAKLEAIFKEITEKGFFSYQFNEVAFKENLSLFEALDLKEKKKTLLTLLDKNQLYVPLSEIEDKDYNFSPEIINLNKSFYH